MSKVLSAELAEMLMKKRDRLVEDKLDNELIIKIETEHCENLLRCITHYEESFDNIMSLQGEQQCTINAKSILGNKRDEYEDVVEDYNIELTTIKLLIREVSKDNELVISEINKIDDLLNI